MLCLVGGQEPGNLPFPALAGRDEWFSDDLKKLDDENVYRKLQGIDYRDVGDDCHEPTPRIDEISKSFLSRQKRNLQSAV